MVTGQRPGTHRGRPRAAGCHSDSGIGVRSTSQRVEAERRRTDGTARQGWAAGESGGGVGKQPSAGRRVHEQCSSGRDLTKGVKGGGGTPIPPHIGYGLHAAQRSRSTTRRPAREEVEGRHGRAGLGHALAHVTRRSSDHLCVAFFTKRWRAALLPSASTRTLPVEGSRKYRSVTPTSAPMVPMLPTV